MNIFAQDIAGRAAELVRRRHLREELLPRQMFGEPAWDMLLILCAEPDSVRHTVASLAKIIERPLELCRRWLDYLGSEGLVDLDPSCELAFGGSVQLTNKGKNSVRRYFSIVGPATP